MSDTLLEAGAILAGPPGDGAADAMTARAYHHPVLDGRTVVRLVGETVGPAEDLTMEFLGFTPSAEPVPVGHARRQALGFPAWALVHDPANGRHALALVKEMEKLARLARGKPGHAKDGYDVLATRLGATVPSFLPTFWEQAGRAFLAADNQRSAATCFTAARRAEQVHGLTVDEDRVRDVHLEFAFAGALTAAMLAEYARGVVGRRPAPEAYGLVRTLALRRIAGGLPPHVSMAADLARLAKAAGLDPEQEADEIVGQLLHYPAMGRAHQSVWKSYRRSLVRVGRRDPEVRSRLLTIVPDPPGYRVDIAGPWLELLEATGAAADLADATGAATEPGSASRWLERFLAGRRSGHGSDKRDAGLLALVERLLPRLAAEGPLDLAPDPWRTELDVLDMCLAGGVRVEIGQAATHSVFDVAEWVSDDGPGRRDLAAVAADPAGRRLLRQGVRQAISRLRNGESLTGAALPEQTLRHAFGATGIREVMVELITDLSGRAGDGTISSLDADLTELAALWSPAGMALAPDGFRRLLGVDLAAVVARSLRAGLPEELCWPAYETAAKQLKGGIQIGEAWPELVVHDKQTAHIIAPDSTVTEHLFRYPPAGHRFTPYTWSGTTCTYVDGDLHVAWNGEDGSAAYWSSRPGELIEGSWQSSQVGWGVPAEPLAVPGGGLTTGVRPVHAGDATAPSQVYPVSSDGQAYWRCEFVRAESGRWEWRWREFDPRTGDEGRISVPAFFAVDPAGGRVDIEACRLRPVPAEFAASPLGTRDGLAGWRVVTAPDGTQTGEGVDGRRAVLPAATRRRLSHNETLYGALSLPGSAAPLPVTRVGAYPHGQLQVWTADGEHLLARQNEATSTMPPLAWWHALRARDEAGSAALRAIDERTAAALLAVDDAVTGTLPVRAAVAANVQTHLPAVTDQALRDRIAEVLARVVRMRRRIAEIPTHLGAQPQQERELPVVTDSALREAWEGLYSVNTYYGGSADARYETIEQVRLVGALLGGAGDPAAVPEVSAEWTNLLAGLGAVALRAAAAVTSAADREALTAFLATVAGTPLAGDGPPLRVVEVSQQRAIVREVDVRRDGSATTVLFPAERNFYRDTPWKRLAVQIAPDGAFPVPDGTTLGDEARPSGRMTGERLPAFQALLAERGPAPWRPEAAEALAAATGMSRAEAILLLAGLPGIAGWEANFLTTEQRAVLGLTAAHAKVARLALRDVTPEQRVALLDAAMPTDPAALWEHGPDVAAIAEQWIRLRGRRATVPEDLVGELDRIVSVVRAGVVLQAIAGPQPGDWLSTDGRSSTESYQVTVAADGGVPFDGRYLVAAATALPWLAYRLRWDDPLRSALGAALRLVRARLANPELLVGYAMYETSAFPQVGPALVKGHTHGDYSSFHVAPAKLSGLDDPALGYTDEQTATALRILLSDWIDRVVALPAETTGDPHDPRVSAPALLGAVRERFGLDTEAAAYYLQLLALPDPTDKAVQTWNGWKAAQLRKAREALIAAGPVVAAKRERAGRAVFLPGGWLPARAPMLPVETWKQELYLQADNQRLVTRPLPDLFAAAWARVTAGDVPRYHTLEEKP